ncbi:UvrD-helicase domain-containing protein [Pseudobacteriovorax antillogorgiicola]|uniref:DNA 3'-5' helicase n=1 Tax=Pseudobacteriovorax antillogorgiicola TaxID=1513793 RepID=A0A1Y6CLQ4_9BACT|nr:UvrD-helicase domain-containing protein [Pseudobacteriovorax antillogorgiicola]TCS45034.1 ATP-dependent exoDNAse (exonuclease V) beta subunit [Pseudobacteriovorax antillogorgiicola]SMF76149.1 ATP-dependent exoDNAse (exonuclease V) beta subunit (contains helicase and exonuclease domains) [Pseudobacteriovorax antillogorgiicola]
MTEETRPNPQNPYISCVVKASAGCGKTYQLSRRFLFLVASGAHPLSILTITFTKKAAAEMRERILQICAQLLQDQALAESFDQSMAEFYRQEQINTKRSMSQPLSASQTARTILSCTQGLRVNTIDSTFLEWVRKFPVESRGDRKQALPPNLDMATETQSQRIDRLAWEKICFDLFDSQPQKKMALTPLELEARVQGIQRHQTYFWLSEVAHGQAFKPIPSPKGYETLPQTWPELIAAMVIPLKNIIEQTSAAKRDLFLTALTERSVESLQSLRLLTKDFKVSGATIRGKKREALAHEISEVEEAFAAFRDGQRIASLNDIGSILCRLFKGYSIYRDQVKHQQGLMEFEDTAKGCYNLFANPDAQGARFLIHQQIKHMMLDEFQDTSRLQWSIFRNLANEMLSGEGLEQKSGTPSTVFIVGDEKQSIYGFREADASILLTAAEELGERGVKEIPLNHSYRTSQLVLDLVNQVFPPFWNDFPVHQTAAFSPNQIAIPNYGTIAVSPLFEDVNAIEQEVSFVAQYLKDQLSNQETLVFDKATGGMRPLEPQDCAILYRASTHVPHLEKALRDQGLESRREESRGFFDRQEVRDLIHLVKFLCFQSDLLSFMAVIKSPLCDQAEKPILEAIVAQKGAQTPQETVCSILFDLEQRGSQFAKTLLELMNRATHVSPSELFIQIYHDLNPVSLYKTSFGGTEGLYGEANLQKLLDMVIEQENQNCTSLQQLLQFLEEKAKEDSIGASSPSDRAINLMTIHKSKGLEFPLVVVIGLGEAWEKRDPYWVKNSSGAQTGLSYVGTQNDRPVDFAPFKQIYDRVLNDDRDENLRLLYVALTRAKHHLLLTGSRRADSRKEHGFLQHLEKSLETLDAEQQALGDVSFFYKEISWSGKKTMIETSQAERDIDSHRPWHIPQQKPAVQLEIKTLAPNRLLTKPDDASSETNHRFSPFATEAGTFIHEALENVVRKQAIPDEEQWSDLYSHGPKERFQQVGQMVFEEIHQFLKSPLWQSLTQIEEVWPERDIVYLDGDKLIRGTIDLLVREGNKEFSVIDYKTSEPQKGDDLFEYSLRKAYDQQILAYVKAIKALYPGAKVNGAVCYISSNQLVYTHQEYQSQRLQTKETLGFSLTPKDKSES